MTLQMNTARNGAPQIEISGRFDFTANREFRELCKSMDKATECVLDMKSTTYVDSSALGMMLLLKEQVSNVRIVGASAEVRKVLEIANFDRLFSIDD